MHVRVYACVRQCRAAPSADLARKGLRVRICACVHTRVCVCLRSRECVSACVRDVVCGAMSRSGLVFVPAPTSFVVARTSIRSPCSSDILLLVLTIAQSNLLYDTT